MWVRKAAASMHVYQRQCSSANFFDQVEAPQHCTHQKVGSQGSIPTDSRAGSVSHTLGQGTYLQRVSAADTQHNHLQLPVPYQDIGWPENTSTGLLPKNVQWLCTESALPQQLAMDQPWT